MCAWMNIVNAYIYIYWLVVSTPLKNISQLGILDPTYGNIKHVPNHQPDVYIYIIHRNRERDRQIDVYVHVYSIKKSSNMY